MVSYSFSKRKRERQLILSSLLRLPAHSPSSLQYLFASCSNIFRTLPIDPGRADLVSFVVRRIKRTAFNNFRPHRHLENVY